MLHFHSIFAYISICLLSIHCANSNVIEPVKSSDKVGFSWGNCGTGGDPVQIKALSIAPDPIRFPGDVEVTLSVDLVKPFPPDLTAFVIMEKDVLGFWVKVPCVNNVGSCTYQDLCTNVTHLYFNPFESLDTGKKCPPIPAGTYSMENVILPINKSIPSEADGTMRITIDFLSNALGQLGCLQMIVNLTS